MTRTTVYDASPDATSNEWYYRGEYGRWYGFYKDNPVLKAIVDNTADAVVASWRTYGSHDKKAAEILDSFTGRGNETFKTMMNGAVKACILGGDYYAEIVGDEEIENILPLQPNLIQIRIKDNEIQGYEEQSDTSAKWKPEEIFHLAFNRMPGQLHGNSSIEPLNDRLIYYKQLMENGSKIYELYIKPFYLMYTDTDDPSELATIRTELRNVLRSVQDNMILPKGSSELQRMGIPEFSTLDPAKWQRVLLDEIIMSQRTSELILGTGSVNSEEAAKMQMAGFAGYVRWIQKFFEDNIRSQLFSKMFGTNLPKIRFSYAAEPQSDREERILKKIETIGALPPDAMPPKAKMLSILKLLEEVGIIDDR